MRYATERKEIFNIVLKETVDEMIKEITKTNGGSFLSQWFPCYELTNYIKNKVINIRKKYCDFKSEKEFKENIKKLYFSENYTDKIFSEKATPIINFFTDKIDCKIQDMHPQYLKNWYLKDRYHSIKNMNKELKILTEAEFNSKTFAEILELFNKNYIRIYYIENKRHKIIKTEKELLDKLELYLTNYFWNIEEEIIYNDLYYRFLIELEKRYKNMIGNLESDNIFGIVKVDNSLLINIIKEVEKELLADFTITEELIA